MGNEASIKTSKERRGSRRRHKVRKGKKRNCHCEKERRGNLIGYRGFV